MSVHPTSMIRSFATAASIIGSLAFAGVAAAADPSVTQISGNQRCSDIDPSYTEVKIDNPRQGRTDFAGGSIVIKGLYLEWTGTPVDAVIVKGGEAANVYAGDDEMTTGTGLHAPINSSGRPAGISHVQFCTDGVDAPARSQSASTPGPCEPGGPQTMPDGKPCSSAPKPTVTGTGEGEGEVLGTTVRGGTPATARMHAPGACVKGAYVTFVRGAGIRRVTMFANGRKLRTFRGSRTRYAVTINPDRFRSGVMRLKARVEFVEKSKRAKTFRMTVLRCAKAAVEEAPAFAG